MTMTPVQIEELVPLLAIAVGGVVLVFWILCATIEAVAKGRQLERSRREIAAYVAEGSMTPEQGERLLKAGPKEDSES